MKLIFKLLSFGVFASLLGCSNTSISQKMESDFVLHSFQFFMDDALCQKCVQRDMPLASIYISDDSQYSELIYDKHKGTKSEIKILAESNAASIEEENVIIESFLLDKTDENNVEVTIIFVGNNDVKIHFVKKDNMWLSYSTDLKNIYTFLPENNITNDDALVKLAFDFVYNGIFCRACIGSPMVRTRFFINRDSSYSESLFTHSKIKPNPLEYVSDEIDWLNVSDFIIFKDFHVDRSGDTLSVIISTEYSGIITVDILNINGFLFPFGASAYNIKLEAKGSAR